MSEFMYVPASYYLEKGDVMVCNSFILTLFRAAGTWYGVQYTVHTSTHISFTLPLLPPISYSLYL